jgi:hypothetical protein
LYSGVVFLKVCAFEVKATKRKAVRITIDLKCVDFRYTGGIPMKNECRNSFS